MAAPPPNPLLKHKSWSPDSDREEAWLRRKDLHKGRRHGRLSRSVTAEDLDELRVCIDLGFELDSLSDSGSSRLNDAFPALELYSSVRSAGSSPLSIYCPGESPEQVKAKLRQWAQVVTWSLSHPRF